MDLIKEYWVLWSPLLKEPWLWNCVFMLVGLVWLLFYEHIKYLKLKKLWSRYQYHTMAAKITMRESGIFTKYWIRAFVKGAERWF